MNPRLALLFFSFALLNAEVRLPPYKREVLPNGVVIYLVPKAGVPLIDFRIILKGGRESEPDGLAGIASVSAQLLRKGTATRTADQFSDQLDTLGGSFHQTSNEQATVIASEFINKDFSAGLNLTSDVVLHPSFPDAEVKKTLAQDIDEARSMKDNPQAAIRQYFAAFFYGPNHPYGRVEDESSISRMTRDNIVDYVKRTYVGNNMIVVVGGDFDESTVLPELKKVFAEVPAGKRYEWATNIPPVAGNRLLLIDKPDATQTYFRIAQPGISRTDPDRTTLLLLNTLFGGRFTSMLNDELRVNSGLTYGANCILDLNRDAGAITIASYTRTETTGKAMDLALEVLRRMNEKGITAEQLSSVKAYVKGLYPTQNLETSDQLAAILGDMEIFGLNKGEVDDLFSRIDSVTLEHANATAKKWYKSGSLTFVVLGNASKIRDAVKKYAPQITEVSVKAPGYTSAGS
jgi:predicted Zn-dependent peptidase